MFVDFVSGDFVGCVFELLFVFEEQSVDECYMVIGELLMNMIEVMSGIGDLVVYVVDDIVNVIIVVCEVMDLVGIELFFVGSYLFVQWYDQDVMDKLWYYILIECIQWWGCNMMIWGIYVYIGVEDQCKVFFLINVFLVFLLYFQVFFVFSLFWVGECIGYVLN